MMNTPVFIAGIGAISAIGTNVAESLAALEYGHAGMDTMRHLDSVHRNHLPVAEVRKSNEQLVQDLGLDKVVSRTALLSMTAASEALKDAAIPDFSSLRTGFVSAKSSSRCDE